MRARTFAFRSDDLTLSGELVVPAEPRAALLLCHGIPGGGPPDPTDPGYAGFARTLAARGFAAAWFTFRGCREAPGEFSIGGWRTDLASALDALRAAPEIRSLPVVVIGSSAGGSTALAVCAQRADVSAVATLAAPAGFARFGDAHGLLARLRNIGIVRDPAFPPDPEAWAAEITGLQPDQAIALMAPRPVLIVHGEADDVVDYPDAERLFAAARAPKELVRIPAGGHQLRRDPRAVDALCDWLDAHIGRFAVSVPSPDHEE